MPNVRPLLLFSFMLFSIIFVTSFGSAFADGPPEPVTDLIAVPGNGEIHLIWTAPYDNQVPIQNYKIVMWKTGSDIFTTFPNISTTTRAVANGLTNDVSYNFKVIAKNSRGESPDSNIVSAKPSISASMFVPDKITDLKATRGDGKVLLSWSPPFNGGTQVTGYKIYFWEIGSGEIKTKTLTGKADGAQITDLVNEVPYRFKIVAINSMGHGPDSNVVSATPSSSSIAKVPNQVRGVTAIGSDGQVLVTWISPSANGSPIKNYKIIVSESGSSVFTTYPGKGNDTQMTITGLKNGIKYGFKVVAINSIGEGQASGSAFATPEKKISIEISNLRAVAGNGKADLSWSVADDKLQQITGYRVREYQSNSNTFVVHDIIGKTTKTTIWGLSNGVSYGFSILPVTDAGLGPISNIVSVIPKITQVEPGAPGSISDLRVVSGNNQASLSWSMPNDNGNKITEYHIQQFKRGESVFVTIPKFGSTPNAVIQGLTNGITYDFKVIPINSIGQGPVSNMVSVTPGSTESKIIIPSWIKNNAKWWSDGIISDSEYVSAIEYLINQGIIKLK